MGQDSPTILLQPRRGLAVVYLLLGGVLLALGLVFPWVATSPGWGLLLITMPCLGTGALALASGWGLRQARLLVDDQGLELVLPSWRGFPCPPRRNWRLAWSEIKALERRPLGFRVFIMAGPVPLLPEMEVVIYHLHTSQGPIDLVDRTLPHLAEALDLLAQRHGLTLLQAPPRRASLWRVLWNAHLSAE